MKNRNKIIQYLKFNAIDAAGNLGATGLLPVQNILNIRFDGGIGIHVSYKATEKGKLTTITLLFYPNNGYDDGTISITGINQGKDLVPLYVKKLLSSEENTLDAPWVAMSNSVTINA